MLAGFSWMPSVEINFAGVLLCKTTRLTLSTKTGEHSNLKHQNVDLKLNLLLPPAGVHSFIGIDCSKGFSINTCRIRCLCLQDLMFSAAEVRVEGGVKVLSHSK